jgi:UDP-N-acetylglucosamine acyltransferase
VSRIHPSAVVESGARLGADVEIGPFCHVGPAVSLGDGVKLVSHVAVAGWTTIGAGARIFPFASIGHEPQDLKYQGEKTRLVIGANCLIREGVTMNPGTAGGGGETVIGDDCVFLSNSHVGHDCRLEQGVLLSSNVMLAGHIKIGKFAILSGGSAVHQFVRIGAYAFLGGLTGVGEDLIPFGLAIGNRGWLAGINIVGMKRRGFAQDEIHAVRRAFKQLFSGDGTLKSRIEQVAGEFGENEGVQQIVAFLREGGERSVLTPRDGRDEGP